jgi:hypothetical protein
MRKKREVDSLDEEIREFDDLEYLTIEDRQDLLDLHQERSRVG